MKKIRLLLADDQAMFRAGLRLLLAAQADFEIVAEAVDGDEAVASARQHRPDVILMDLRMPRRDGVAATRVLVAENFSGRILVLTTFEDDEEVFAALAAGAAGYLLKASPVEKLLEAIRLTARGESFLEPSVTVKVLAHFSRLAGQTPRRAAPPPLREPLSARELDVLRLLAEGRSNKEIAVGLAIAEGTVKNHMSNVLGKLGALDRTQAALRAREFGLI
jgi:DNA-binding NarL/FixJ family response regulator